MTELKCGIKNSEDCPAGSTEERCIKILDVTCNYNRNFRYCSACAAGEKCDYCADLCTTFARFKKLITG